MLHRGRCWLVLALARGEYSEGRGVKLAEKTFEHLRVLWEAFVQHEYDAFRRLSLRAVAGTGPALRLVERTRGSLTAGVAYLVEHCGLDPRSGRVLRHRWAEDDFRFGAPSGCFPD